MARASPGKLKDALGRLFMKIHPDMLWAAPERRKLNESSMQGLNEILAWEKGLRRGVLQPPPGTRRVEFFTKDDEAGAGRKIEAEFVLPKGFTPSAEHVAEASKAVNTFLSQLLIRGEVLGASEQKALEQADDNLRKWKELSQRRAAEQRAPTVKVADVVRAKGETDEEWERRRREAQRLQKYEAMGDFGAAFDQQDMEVPEGAHEASEMPNPLDREELRVPPVQPKKKVVKQRERAVLGHLADDFHKLMKDFWSHEDVPGVAELITSDMIHYDTSLSPVDCAKAVETLQNHLPSLRYDLWYFVPLYITTRFGVEADITGFLSVPYHFTPEDFLRFLSDNEPLLRDVQQRAFDGAKDFERQLAAARKEVGLGDLVVRCSVGDAAGAMTVLRECAEELRDAGWVGMVAEIVEPEHQYGARDTGILQIPADATRQGLQEFCAYLQQTDQLTPLKERYATTLAKLGELDRLMSVCYEVLEPHAIDLESDNHTIDDKLQFIKELYGITGELSRYDWSDYTFALGDLELNWEEGVLTLPANFHGPNFATTVHRLHKSDNEAFNEEEPSDESQLALDLEARRIRSELAASGLLELDPEKQTEQQRQLMRMIETYGSNSEENIQEYIKESFPQYLSDHQAKEAMDLNLITASRAHHKEFVLKKMRRYFRERKRPRAGSSKEDWDFS